MATTQGKVFKAFQKRYAEAHLVEYGSYPGAEKTEAAYQRIIGPIRYEVEKNWDGNSEARRALFLKEAVFFALQSEEAIEQARHDAAQEALKDETGT